MNRVRVEPELKREAEEVLGELGMSNAETIEALHQARRSATQSIKYLPVDPIERYLHEQRSGIVRVFNEQEILDAGAVAFCSWAEMERQIQIRGDHSDLSGSRFERVGRRSLENVRSFYNARWDQWQCWVRAGYRDYRRAFLAWLVERGFGVEPQAIASYDVDHLFSAARAPSPDHVIRLILVNREVNRSWGGWAEKLDSGRDTKSRNNARYHQIAKAVGIPAPDSIPERLDRPGGFQELATALIDAGVEEVRGSQMSDEIAFMFRAIEQQATVVAVLC